MPTESAQVLSLIAVVVISGNAAIWWGMATRHARLRAELRRDATLFLEQDVGVALSAWSVLGAGIGWMRADVWITEKAAILFQRTSFDMPQPPIALFRSEQEAAANKRWLVVGFVVGELVIHEAEHALSIRSAKGFTRRKLKLRPKDPTALAAALESCLNRTAHKPRTAGSTA